MKFINKFKSPNYNNRKLVKIKFVIIHYTALKDTKAAIGYMCNANNKVSSHYLISKNGNIFNLVDEKKRAWHAGISYWNNSTDINSSSIGIELDYFPKKTNNKFSKNMIISLIDLLIYLKKKYNITNDNILGHSDIAPLRKRDPGPNFPWKKLQKKNLAYEIKKNQKINNTLLKKWFNLNGLNTDRKIAIFILGYIGYNASIINNNKLLNSFLKAYQSRFIQNNVSAKLDKITINFLIKHFINLVLTKN